MATSSPLDAPAAPTRETTRRAAAGAPLLAAPLVGGAAVAVAIGVAIWSGAGALIHRPLWLDEVVTQLVATAPRGILHAMRSGVDFQPPPHYALVWLSGWLLDANDALAARLPSIVAAALTVFVLGAFLRTRLSATAALAGALALAAHPFFIGQAFEARPYALWILATALTAVALRVDASWGRWLTAAAAVALCTSHYFGILSLVAIAAAAAAFLRFGRHERWTRCARVVAPLAAGGFALLALLPLARAQLATTSGRSWVAPVTSGDVAYFLGFIWGWRPALHLIAAGVLVAVARRALPQFRRAATGQTARLDITSIALLATATVPLLVVLLSVGLKPLLVLRYSAPALLAVATVCAFAVEQLPRQVRWLALVLLARAALFSFQSASGAARDATALAAHEARAVRQLAAQGVATMSAFRHDAYLQSRYAAGAPTVAWLDLPDSLVARAAAAAPALVFRDHLLVERGFGRAVQGEFGFPEVVGIEAARAQPVVAVLRDPSLAPTDSLWFPGRRVCALSPRLVAYARPGAAPSCDALQAAVQDTSARR